MDTDVGVLAPRLYRLVDIRSDETLVFFTKHSEYASIEVPGAKTEVLSIGKMLDIHNTCGAWGKTGFNEKPKPNFANLIEEEFIENLTGRTLAPPAVYHSGVHFAKVHGYWLHKTKVLKDEGAVLFVTENRPFGKLYVVKHQKIPLPDFDFTVSPGPCATELCSLYALNYLMESKGIAPIFCELVEKEVFIDTTMTTRFLSTTMVYYPVDLSVWVSGDGRDPNRTCVKKPPFAVSADPGADWIYTACAGHHLAISPHQADHALFNKILRGVLLQVCIGLNQAQHHCMFTHNDMHAGNVMFDVEHLKKRRLFVTGAGSFMLGNGYPGVRIIDFQHTTMDVYNSSGTCTARMQGFSMDNTNAFSLTFDLQRLCCYLSLSLLRPYWKIIELDIRLFLLKAAQLTNDVDNPQFKQIPAEVQWSPFHLTGLTPNEALREPVFDCLRCEATEEFHLVYYEKMPTAEQQDRYNRAAIFRNKNALPSSLSRSALAVDQYKTSPEFQKLLHSFAGNYSGNALGRALLMHKHEPQAKWNFVHMQYSQLLTALYFLWTYLVDEIQEILKMEGDQKFYACALVDAVVSCVKLDYLWILRPEHLKEYHDLVEMYLKKPSVRALIREKPPCCADAVVEYKKIAHDSEIECWRAILYNAVMGALPRGSAP